MGRRKSKSDMSNKRVKQEAIQRGVKDPKIYIGINMVIRKKLILTRMKEICEARNAKENATKTGEV